MPVQKAKLKKAIKDAFIAERNKTSDPEASADRIATAIADAVSEAAVEAVNTAEIALANSGGPVTGTITASTV